MTTIFNLNEFTALRFLFSATLGRMPVVLAVDPLFPPFRRILDGMAERAVAKGRARWIIDLCPELQHLWDYPTRTFLYDVFGQTEDWHNAYYEFDRADTVVPDYAMTYKKATCNHAKPRHYHTLLLGAALAAKKRGKVRVVGLAGDFVGLMNAYWSGSLTPALKTMWVPRRTINALVTLLIQIFALAWVGSRTQPIISKPKDYFFGADYCEDQRDHRLYHEVADGGPLLLVYRHPKSMYRPPQDDLSPYEFQDSRAGRFGPMQAVAAMAMVIRDGAGLFRHFAGSQPALYFRIATLPFRRAVLRAFFNRFRPKFFWGRDDYNEDHVLRHRELRRVGGVSMGICHGYPAYAYLFPQWRYISFDRYYVHGQAVYEREMKKSWPDDMKVVAVGSFGATRSDYALRHAPKPNDIVVYSAVFVGNPKMVDFVRGLAEAFPERKVLLQIKHNFIDTPVGKAFARDCMESLSNIELVTAPLFDLTRQARYAFSDPSTVIVEALQFGQYAFFADLMAEQKKSVYREYPAICVGSAEDAATRIHAIEAGEKTYPLEALSDLVDLSGRVLFDVIREEMKLPLQLTQDDLEVVHG